MATLPPRRRRQRSVREVTCVGLLSVATATVIAALLVGGTLAIGSSAVLAVGCAWALARIAASELRCTRRAAAADRAELAHSYAHVQARSTADAVVTRAAMTRLLAARDGTIAVLRAMVDAALQRAVDAEAAAREEAARRSAVEKELEALAEALQVRHAEEADELASWEPREDDTVVDLLAWEERSSSSAAPAPPWQRRHA